MSWRLAALKESLVIAQAYAAARMAESVLRGMAGETGVYEAAYVASKVTELPYFATKACPAPRHAHASACAPADLCN